MLEVRTLAADDAEQCAWIAREAIWVLAAGHYTEAQRQAWMDRFSGPMMADRMGGCFSVGAWIEGRLAGFGILSPALAEIGYVYADPAFRGRRTGTAIMEALIAEARRIGLARVSLTASLNASGFYERLGFLRGEASERCLGCENLPCVRMTLSLG